MRLLRAAREIPPSLSVLVGLLLQHTDTAARLRRQPMAVTVTALAPPSTSMS
jgi:hypothetical protein